MRAALKRPDVKGTPGLEEIKAMASANPQSFGVQMQLGVELRKAKDAAGALAAFERASQILPRAPQPYSMIASAALEQKDNTRAIRALEALVRLDASDVDSARMLASLLEPGGDAARIEDAYARVVAIDPFDAHAQAAYGRLVFKRGDADAALKALRTVLALNPPDRATAHTDLAEIYIQKRQLADAKREVMAALEIAPAYERAQDLLLRLVD
jgi:cytochrome c-type biogenesis protein CcmH/NrfG